MSKYLLENRSTSLSKLIFDARSGTLDIKEWNMWKYEDHICVKCEIEAEIISHLMTCSSYEKESNVEDIFGNNPNIQYEISKKIGKRLQIREMQLEETDLDSDPGSRFIWCSSVIYLRGNNSID